MRRAFLLLAFSLAACSSQAPCSNAVHDSCDFDGGTGCPVHQTCIDAESAIDACQAGAQGCCFQVCTVDTDCPDGFSCPAGYCAEGRCIADAGP